jgi:mRNA deadenylase 3'-5' endonuclease subunit Ccr4
MYPLLLLLSSPTDADVVCLQEVSPVSFEDDFAFMAELGYDGKEMYKKGRFRPATFWKTSQCELAAPPVHKDRTLLTSFRLLHKSDAATEQARNWYVLNCHLQAGKQSKRRLRQINEGVRAVVTLAKKLKGAYRICSTVYTF